MRTLLFEGKNICKQFINRLGFLGLLLSLQHSTLAQDKLATPVRVIEVAEKLVNPSIAVMGNLFSRQESPITTSVDGRLTWISEPGAEVKRGDIIARFDKQPLRLQESEQKAVLNRAKIQLEFLQKELERLKTLKQNKIASDTQLEDVQLRLKMTESDIEIASARLEQLRERLERTEIKAPHDGVIITQLHYAGEDLRAGEVLTQLIDNENLELRLFVPNKHLPHIQIAKEIQLSDGRQSVAGLVRSLIPRSDPRSQTVELRVDVPKSMSQYWTIGQLIRAKLPVGSGQSSLTIHRDALLLRNNGNFVVKIDEQNKAHRIPVKVGEGEDEWLAISATNSMLKAGDKVAIRGAELLQEGDRVIIQASAS